MKLAKNGRISKYICIQPVGKVFFNLLEGFFSTCWKGFFQPVGRVFFNLLEGFNFPDGWSRNSAGVKNENHFLIKPKHETSWKRHIALKTFPSASIKR